MINEPTRQICALSSCAHPILSLPSSRDRQLYDSPWINTRQLKLKRRRDPLTTRTWSAGPRKRPELRVAPGTQNATMIRMHVGHPWRGVPHEDAATGATYAAIRGAIVNPAGFGTTDADAVGGVARGALVEHV